MTIGIAFLNDKGCWLASDSRIMIGDTIISDDTHKIQTVWGEQDEVLQFTMSGEILALGPVISNVLKRMMTSKGKITPLKFTLELRTSLEAAGLPAHRCPGEDHAPGWPFEVMITDGHSLWVVDGSGAVLVRGAGEYEAIGSGARFALGGLALIHNTMGDEDSIVSALEGIGAAVLKCCASCGGKIRLARMEPMTRVLFDDE